MIRIIRLLLPAVLLSLPLTACREKPAPDTSHGGRLALPRAEQYPIPFTERPYRDVHENVKQAWFITESAYLVVAEKYRAARSGEQRGNVTQEIEQNLFGVNETVEQLFLDAIAAEPENPLNHAAYSFYLKPRKRFVEGGFRITDLEAREQIDKAIELWPDESSFYLQKVHLLTAPHQAYEYFRAGAMEELAIIDQMSEIRDALTQAERYYPSNHFINYWSALLQFRFTPEEHRPRIKETLLREIRAGNGKAKGYFAFPPPVQPFNMDSRVVLIDASHTEAIYYDHWTHCGKYSQNAANQMVMFLLEELSWPRDKAAIADLIFFYYNLGRTEPFDRSYFSMQQVVLEKLREKVGKDHPDAAKLAEAHRYLNDQYRTLANRLHTLGVITDPAKVNVRGVNEAERGPSRQENLKVLAQPRHGAFIKRFGDLLDIRFNLSEDPRDW